MSRPWILVTPASRGIGHALTRHLLRTTTVPILATARRDPDAVKARLLQDLETTATTTTTAPPDNRDGDAPPASDRLHVLPLDVTSEPSIAEAAARARELFPPGADGGRGRGRGRGQDRHHLHLAFAIPGVLHPEKSPRQVDAEAALATYRVNALGPLLLMKHFGDLLPRRQAEPLLLPGGAGRQQQQQQHRQGQHEEQGLRLPPHAVWLSMSARVGSVSDNKKGGWYSYRSSKAAVNALAKTFDLQLLTRSGERAMAIAYHPGTVRTDLSRDFWGSVDEEKLFEPEYAVERMVEVVTSKIGLEGRGRCWDWKGEEILP